MPQKECSKGSGTPRRGRKQSGLGQAEVGMKAGQMWGPAKVRKRRASLGTCPKAHSLGALLGEDKRIRKRKLRQGVNERTAWRRPQKCLSYLWPWAAYLPRSLQSHWETRHRL